MLLESMRGSALEYSDTVDYLSSRVCFVKVEKCDQFFPSLPVLTNFLNHLFIVYHSA